MVSTQNIFFKFFGLALGLIFLLAFSQDGYAQKSRKKQENKDERTDYAYRTISTLKKKEKRESFSGNQSRFQVEKPLEPVTFGRIDRIVDYSKPPYFGHKRPPIRRPVGSTKWCRVCEIKH